MDEQRIKKAQNNVKGYIDDGKLHKITHMDKLIYNTYLKNARESLRVADMLCKEKSSSLWVVVTSYYSMFYMACAYLYNIGYKTKGEIVHQVINDTLIVQARHKIKNHILKNYDEEKEKALTIVDNYLDNYEREKAKRASFQYETTEEIKESKAKTSLERAKEFLTLMEEIMHE